MEKVIQIQNISKQELYDHLEGIVDAKLDELQKKDTRLTVQAVAEELSVNELTVHNWIKKGNLPAEKIGRRVYIRRSNLDKALMEVKSLKYKR